LQRLHAEANAAPRIAAKAAQIAHVLLARAGSETLPAHSAHRPPGYGYGVQSDILKREGKDAMTAGVLLAGASAFKTMGANYTFMPKTPGEMSGLTSPQPPSGLGGPP
jgi:hypothetical protein